MAVSIAARYTRHTTAMVGRDKERPIVMFARYLLSGLFVVPIVWILAIFPLTSWPLATAIVLYAAVLWRWPVAFLLILPAVLAALDLGFWTGWTVLKSHDLFVLATFAVLIARVPLRRADFSVSGWPRAVLLLLIASYAVGTAIGLSSPLGYTGHSNNPYLRPDNALRLLKGVVEALGLLPFMRQRHRTHGDTPLWLGRGIAAGLAIVAIEVAIERALFVGLMDFGRLPACGSAAGISVPISRWLCRSC